MWLSGITEVSNIPQHQGFIEPVALSLLGQSQSTAEEHAVFEFVIGNFRHANGTYRCTYRARFSALDPVVREILDHRFPGQPIEIRDWACSDGLSTKEWAESLADRPIANLIGSDQGFHVVELRHNAQRWYFEHDGTPLQLVWGKLVIDLNREPSWRYPVNRLLFHWAQGQLKSNPALAAKTIADLQEKDGQAAHLCLLHPEARQFSGAHGWLHFRPHSIFNPEPSPVHALRTMNILNRGYFAEPLLAKAIACVHASLVDGGIWIVGRTDMHDLQRSAVSIYRKSSSGFTKLYEAAGGSEIDGLIAQCYPTA